VTQASWSPDALEELVAPIALYPDALLGQILAASVNPQEVLDAGNWLLQNQALAGDELDAAAEKAGFGPAMRALVKFPTVVDMMCQEIDWTRQLGSAFTSDQKSVLDAVQRLRAQAAEAGNLESTPQQQVETKEVDDRTVIEVKPADPQVVYVPQYDPQVVYTTPPPPPTQSTTTSEDTVSTGAAVAGGLIAFGVGVMLGHAMDDDDDYYPYPHWGAGVVFVGPRPFYPPAYVYRPAYGPAFHPAYRYAPPPGYRHSYNNVNVNVNRNIVVNHNNYFNRFDNHQNLRVDRTGETPSIARRDLDSTRVGTDPKRSSESWEGRSTYAGARDERKTSDALKRDDALKRSNAALRERAEPRSAPSESLQRVDRGYGHSTQEMPRHESRDARPALPADRELRQESPARDHTFAGAARPNAGSFERAASARGHASAGAGHGGHAAHAGRRR
jgi:hypothetical protein